MPNPSSWTIPECIKIQHWDALHTGLMSCRAVPYASIDTGGQRNNTIRYHLGLAAIALNSLLHVPAWGRQSLEVYSKDLPAR